MAQLFIGKKENGDYFAFLGNYSWRKFVSDCKPDKDTAIMEIKLDDPQKKFLDGLMQISEACNDDLFQLLHEWLLHPWKLAMMGFPLRYPYGDEQINFQNGVRMMCKGLRSWDFATDLLRTIWSQAKEWKEKRP